MYGSLRSATVEDVMLRVGNCSPISRGCKPPPLAECYRNGSRRKSAFAMHRTIPQSPHSRSSIARPHFHLGTRTLCAPALSARHRPLRIKPPPLSDEKAGVILNGSTINLFVERCHCKLACGVDVQILIEPSPAGLPSPCMMLVNHA